MDETEGVWVGYYEDWSGFTLHRKEVEALRWAVDHHASVIWVEWGGDPRDAANKQYRAMMKVKS